VFFEWLVDVLLAQSSLAFLMVAISNVIDWICLYCTI